MQTHRLHGQNGKYCLARRDFDLVEAEGREAGSSVSKGASVRKERLYIRDALLQDWERALCPDGEAF